MHCVVSTLSGVAFLEDTDDLDLRGVAPSKEQGEVLARPRRRSSVGVGGPAKTVAARVRPIGASGKGRAAWSSGRDGCGVGAGCRDDADSDKNESGDRNAVDRPASTAAPPQDTAGVGNRHVELGEAVSGARQAFGHAPKIVCLPEKVRVASRVHV